MSDARKIPHLADDGANHDQVKKVDYKLLIDPQIRRGEEKLLRYNGETYNTENHGQGVVIMRDPRPRMNRLWSRRERADLPVPRYKVDEWYIGAVPPREVTFSKLNDNITKQFMERMCSKFGKLERVRVYHHPKTQKHMGLSKVVFSSMKSAGECVKSLHMTSIMGNVIHAQIDSKGELLNKLFQRIARGEMVAETIPDVIRHTQDGISMSKKYKENCIQTGKDNRRTSIDDPRKLRHSVDESEGRLDSMEEEKLKPDSNRDRPQNFEHHPVDDMPKTTSVEHEDRVNYSTRRKSSYEADESQAEVDNEPPVDLESRITSLLQGNKHAVDIVKGQHSDGNDAPNSEVLHKQHSAMHSREKSIVDSSKIKSEYQDGSIDSVNIVTTSKFHNDMDSPRAQSNTSPLYRKSANIDRSPDDAKYMYPNTVYKVPAGDNEPLRSHPHKIAEQKRREFDYNQRHEGGRYSPKHLPTYPRDRNAHGYHDRGRFTTDEYDRNIHRSNSDIDFKRRESFHSRRRSPPGHTFNPTNDWQHPDSLSNQLPRSYYHRSSPPRFNHSCCSPRDRREMQFEHRYSPNADRWRRSRNSSRNRDFRSRSRSPSPVNPRSERSAQRVKSSRCKSPKLTLDQRLKEMTGESVNNGGRIKKRKREQGEQEHDSSVDMEISEGDSDADEFKKRSRDVEQKLNYKNDIPGSDSCNPPVDGWNMDGAAWNNFGPNIKQSIEPRIWNSMQHNIRQEQDRDSRGHFHVRFPSERWMGQFQHQIGVPGYGPPYPFLPNENFHSVPRPINPPVEYGMDEGLCRCVLDNIVSDLKAIVGRDINRKVVETIAFKVYEAWWDENACTKNVSKATTPISNIEKEQSEGNSVPESDVQLSTKQRNNSLLNAFDPLNWAKNSFEMDGFRIGLGLRSAISKMPSFRVKKRPRTPSPSQDDENKDAVVSKKARRSHENKKQRRGSKGTKYYHISTLDSEGEDDGNRSDESDVASSSDHESKIKPVLNVDEVFSESSSSEDESSSESEKSMDDDHYESEDEEILTGAEERQESTEKASTATAATHELESDVSDAEQHPGKDEERNKVQEASPAKTPTSTSGDFPASGDDPNIAASLLSPTALGVTASSITPQQLRHVHPKKRHRLLSQDQYLKTPTVDRKDDLSMITEKERTVLEALADMQRTPDRRFSMDSDDSTSTAVSPMEQKLPEPQTEAQRDSSPQEELEAVAALLSIKKSATPNLASVKSQPSPTKYRRKSSLAESAQMAALAEEHNYFTPSIGPSHYYPSMDPIVAQILEEHNYSQPLLEMSQSYSDSAPHVPLSPSTLSAESLYKFDSEINDVVSSAELVKLRHVKPKKTAREKKQRRDPVMRFPSRNKIEELIVAYEMWCSGLDLEDMRYLRNVYDGYLEKSNAPQWVNDTHWVPHTVTRILSPSMKPKRSRRNQDRSRTSDNPEEHSTGSARTEGYYKLEDMIKLRQRREMYGQDKQTNAVEMSNHIVKNATEVAAGTQASLDKNIGSRETRHFMRRIAADIGSDAGDLFKYNQLMFRKKSVKFKRSSIHGWGLFAEEPIAADEMVIEYVGQVVRSLIAERREVHYTKLGIGSSYLFRIDSDHIIDATKCGNYARFMNHSCNPSCYAKVITVDNAKKIVIYSKGPIKKSQEITYDYKFPLEDNKVMCFCGAENCRRTLN